MATNERNWTSCLTTFYDVLTQVISVLDVTTDIWVCISFHLNGRKTFFIISLTILSLAMVSYTSAFAKYFCDDTWTPYPRNPVRDRILLFLLALPFSPILPFAFHYPEKAEYLFGNLFGLCGVTVKSNINDSSSATASKFKQFFEEKIQKHLGFILESLIEGMAFYTV